MKRVVFLMMLMACVAVATAQTFEPSAYQNEQLDRGFVNINTGATSSFLSWRLLDSDDEHTAFLVLKNGTVVGDTLRNATSKRVTSNATSEFRLVRLQNGVPTDTLAPVAFNKRGYHLLAPNAFHPKAQVTQGVLEDDCRALMQNFFKAKR
jgi:hypothetical protein